MILTPTKAAPHQSYAESDRRSNREGEGVRGCVDAEGGTGGGCCHSAGQWYCVGNAGRCANQPLCGYKHYQYQVLLKIYDDCRHCLVYIFVVYSPACYTRRVLRAVNLGFTASECEYHQLTFPGSAGTVMPSAAAPACRRPPLRRRRRRRRPAKRENQYIERAAQIRAYGTWERRKHENTRARQDREKGLERGIKEVGKKRRRDKRRGGNGMGTCSVNRKHSESNDKRFAT